MLNRNAENLLRELIERIERNEQLLNQIAAELGIRTRTANNAPMVWRQPSSPADQFGISPEVDQLVMQGKKIQAIKIYREQTGAGLREAKETIDAYEQRRR